MIFSLGFLVSGLLALLFLPAFWRRALRLSARRLEMLMPLSMGEIVAERDQLRAEAAVERRRVEQRVEELIEDRARDMSEIGRRAGVIAALDLDVANLKAEAADLTGRLAQRSAELQATLAELGGVSQDVFDLGARLARVNADLETVRAAERALKVTVDEQRAHAAGLETRAASLEVQKSDLEQSLRALQLDRDDKVAAVQKLTDERDFLRLEMQGISTRRDQLTGVIDEHVARNTELETEVRNERRARVKLEIDVASATQAATEAAAREAELKDAHERRIEFLRGSERELAQRIESLRVQNASLQAALEVARKEGGRKSDETASAAAGVSPEDAALLRKSISDIGAQVTRLVGALEEQSDGTPIGERVRALQSKAERQVATG